MGARFLSYVMMVHISIRRSGGTGNVYVMADFFLLIFTIVKYAEKILF